MYGYDAATGDAPTGASYFVKIHIDKKLLEVIYCNVPIRIWRRAITQATQIFLEYSSRKEGAL